MITADLSLRGQIIDGRFKVQQRIGRGGMGIVWLVEHLLTRQQFALKTLAWTGPSKRSHIKRVLREARATAAAQSPHVVRIVDAKLDYVHNGTELPFIVMELLRGESFSSVLEERGTIDASELLWVMQQVCRGLWAAHQRGIIHRDLKPSNIFLARQEDSSVLVKVCDFGIAKLPHTETNELSETGTLSVETGVLMGTPRYMAPEQITRGGREGPNTDQWALALIAYRALTGQSYFSEARNGAELVLAIVHDPITPPSTLSNNVDSAFDAWFLRSCNRDPSKRFPSMESQLMELESALGSPVPRAIEVSDAIPNNANANHRERSDLSETASDSLRSTPEPMSETVRGHGLGYYGVLTLAAAIAVAGSHWLLRPVLRARQSAPLVIPQQNGTVRAAAQGPETTVGSVLPAASQVGPEVGGTSNTKNVERATAGRARIFRPAPSAIQSLPVGASCVKSAQCASRLCIAEVCQ